LRVSEPGELKVRVLHITNEFPPWVTGGLGTAVGGLVSASAHTGIEAGVLYLEDGPPAEETEVIEYTYRGKAEGESVAVKLFRVSVNGSVEVAARVAEEWKPDLIHLHAGWILPFARAILDRFPLPMVYTAHCLHRASYEIGKEPSYILEGCEGQEAALAMAKRVIALTHNEAALIRGYYPEAKSRLRVVGNGIDDSEMARQAAKRVRRNRSPLVLYSGRFAEQKGIRELMAAIPLVLESAPGTCFVLAGGRRESGREELEREWLPPGCYPFRSQIRFTGWLSSDQLQEWYCQADIQVVPSRFEPFGMVILESMLYGLAIAAGDVAGPSEILKHERTGLLFQPGNVEALAHALLRLIKDRQLCRDLGRAAAEEVRANWLWPNLIKKIAGVYEEATDGARP